MKTNDAGKNLIKHFEGLRLDAYKCPAGIWTISWGVTNGVYPGMKITMAEAEHMFDQNLERFERGVEAMLKVSVTENAFSALVAIGYNIGLTALEHSTLIKRVNAQDFKGASEEFSKWVHGGGKILPGLVTRREAEKQLFLA